MPSFAELVTAQAAPRITAAERMAAANARAYREQAIALQAAVDARDIELEALRGRLNDALARTELLAVSVAHNNISAARRDLDVLRDALTGLPLSPPAHEAPALVG